MENDIFGRVYMIVNLVNGKRYVGQTTESIQERFNKHVSKSKSKDCDMLICRAIKKYGKENFVYGEICVAYSQEELNILEGSYMNKYNTLDKQVGYNLKIVAINGKSKHSEETKQKLSQAHLKPERKKQMSKIGKKSRGKTRPNSLSKYVMVTKNGKNWTSRIYENGKYIFLGCFKTEDDAAKARDIAELKVMGDKAILNFPELKEKYLQNEIVVEKINHKKSPTKIRGVYYCKCNKKWIFKRTGFQKMYFKTQLEAEAYALLFFE